MILIWQNIYFMFYEEGSSVLLALIRIKMYGYTTMFFRLVHKEEQILCLTMFLWCPALPKRGLLVLEEIICSLKAHSFPLVTDPQSERWEKMKITELFLLKVYLFTLTSNDHSFESLVFIFFLIRNLKYIEAPRHIFNFNLYALSSYTYVTH